MASRGASRIRSGTPHLSLGENIVLALVGEKPSHGFALATLVGPEATLGQVFRIPRPIVYRALDRLLEAGLIQVEGVQSSPKGPQRTRYQISRTGRKVVNRWLSSPVDHVRDIRTEFLVKFILLERVGGDVVPLVQAQRRVLEPIVAALEQRAVTGPDRVVNSWRYESAKGTMRFLDQLSAVESDSP